MRDAKRKRKMHRILANPIEVTGSRRVCQATDNDLTGSLVHMDPILPPGEEGGASLSSLSAAKLIEDETFRMGHTDKTRR